MRKIKILQKVNREHRKALKWMRIAEFANRMMAKHMVQAGKLMDKYNGNTIEFNSDQTKKKGA